MAYGVAADPAGTRFYGPVVRGVEEPVAQRIIRFINKLGASWEAVPGPGPGPGLSDQPVFLWEPAFDDSEKTRKNSLNSFIESMI